MAALRIVITLHPDGAEIEALRWVVTQLVAAMKDRPPGPVTIKVEHVD